MKPWLVLIWPMRLCAGNVAQDALSFAAGVSPSQNPSCRRPTERYLTSYGAPSVPSFHKHYQHQHQLNIESTSTSTLLHIPSSNTPNIILPLSHPQYSLLNTKWTTAQYASHQQPGATSSPRTPPKTQTSDNNHNTHPHVAKTAPHPRSAPTAAK